MSGNAPVRSDGPVTIVMTAGQLESLVRQVAAGQPASNRRVVDCRAPRIVHSSARPLTRRRVLTAAAVSVPAGAALFGGGLMFADTALGHLVLVALGSGIAVIVAFLICKATGGDGEITVRGRRVD